MYPCTKCGLPLDSPVCPRCGQAHSAPGHPAPTNPASGPPRAPTSFEAPRPEAYSTPGAAWGGTSAAHAAPPPMDPGPPPRSGGNGRIIATVALSVVALLGLGAVAWSFLGNPGDTATQVATITPEATVVPPTPTPEPPPVEPSVAETTIPSTTAAAETSAPVVTEDVEADIQEAARARLEELRDESMPQLKLDGHWVAVLSTKKSGIEDKSQTAKNGSHVFYDDDILALHEDLADRFNGNANVLLVRTSDFGKQRASGDVFWRTIVDRGFFDEEQAAEWCNSHFTGTTQEINNSCLPKPVVPVTDP